MLLLFFLVFLVVPSLSFWGEHHESITEDGLSSFLFTRQARQRIVDANGDVDNWASWLHSPDWHFLMNTLNAGWHEIHDEVDDLVNDCDETDNECLQDCFGSALHTLQDFFSHSSWVRTNDVATCNLLLNAARAGTQEKLKDAPFLFKPCPNDASTIEDLSHLFTAFYTGLGGQCEHGVCAEQTGINLDCDSPKHPTLWKYARASAKHHTKLFAEIVRDRCGGASSLRWKHLLGQMTPTPTRRESTSSLNPSLTLSRNVRSRSCSTSRPLYLSLHYLESFAVPAEPLRLSLALTLPNDAIPSLSPTSLSLSFCSSSSSSATSECVTPHHWNVSRIHSSLSSPGFSDVTFRVFDFEFDSVGLYDVVAKWREVDLEFRQLESRVRVSDPLISRMEVTSTSFGNEGERTFFFRVDGRGKGKNKGERGEMKEAKCRASVIHHEKVLGDDEEEGTNAGSVEAVVSWPIENENRIVYSEFQPAVCAVTVRNLGVEKQKIELKVDIVDSFSGEILNGIAEKHLIIEPVIQSNDDGIGDGATASWFLVLEGWIIVGVVMCILAFVVGCLLGFGLICCREWMCGRRRSGSCDDGPKRMTEEAIEVELELGGGDLSERLLGPSESRPSQHRK